MGLFARTSPIQGALGRALALLAVIGLTASASGATYVYSESPGVWKKLDTAGMKPRVGPPTLSIKAGGITWNLIFQDVVDGTGIGFDDPVRGMSRRLLAGVVTQDVGMLLNYSGLTFEILFGTSQNDGSGFLATAGTYYSDVDGVVDGISLVHAQTGTDPDGGIEDIYCTVDFGFLWRDDPLLSNPVAGEYDLYSVLLHEFTHGMGFASLSTAMGAVPPGFANQPYTRFNDFLARGNGFDLWGTPGPPFFKGTSVDLISDDVVFMGPLATAANGGTPPPIYSSNPFVPGTSLSHWRISIPGGAVMISGIADGTTNRSWAPVDIAALRDIGWLILPPAQNAASDWSLYE